MDYDNPFNPNSVVLPTLFAGRAKDVTNICRKLSQIKKGMHSSFFIHGERGIGKSALARFIRYLAIENDPNLFKLNLLTSYYSVEEGQDIESVLEGTLNKLSDEMDEDIIMKLTGKLGDILKNGKFKLGMVSVELAGTNETQQDITIKDQTVSILTNIIKEITSKDSSKPKDGIMIIIDEMNNLKNLERFASIIRNIVTTLDFEGKGNISFLLIGYDQDVERFFSQDSSARRTFDLFKLDVMPNEEAVQILEKGFDKIGVTYNKDLLERNIKVAGGYPHSIQILGQKILNVDKDKVISEEDWKDGVFDTTVELRNKEFATMYSFGKPTTIKDDILAFLAREDRAMTRKEISIAIGKPNVYQYLIELLRKGALKEDDDDRLFLQSQLFKSAILIDQYIRKIKNTENQNKPS